MQIAGLYPQGEARFTVATYVRHGGPGGENAAMISAQFARYLIENEDFEAARWKCSVNHVKVRIFE